MDFKPSEIALIVFALVLPIGAFALAFVPGAANLVVGLVMDPTLRPVVFFGLALVLFGVLAYRVYTRIRPRPKPPKPEEPHRPPPRMPKI